MSITNQTLGTGAINDQTYTDIITVDGYMYLLPQIINPEGSLEKTSLDITFSYVKNDVNNTVIAQFYTSMDLPASTWESSKKVKYVFDLDLTKVSLVSVAVEKTGKWIVDWTPSNNTHQPSTVK